MQVGDLVKLSSYGNIGPNDLGMIVKFNCQPSLDFPYQVDWFYLQGRDKMHHPRQDLKHAR